MEKRVKKKKGKTSHVTYMVHDTKVYAFTAKEF